MFMSEYACLRVMSVLTVVTVETLLSSNAQLNRSLSVDGFFPLQFSWGHSS